MGRNAVLIRFDDQGYQKLVEGFADYTSRGIKSDRETFEILQSCASEGEESKRELLCESGVSLRVLAIKLARLGNEIPISDLEAQLLEFLYDTPEVYADGFPEADQYGLKPKSRDHLMDNLAPKRKKPRKRKGPEDKSLASKVSLPNHRELENQELKAIMLEKRVKKAMNTIYLGEKPNIDLSQSPRLVGTEGQKYARNYLLSLLIGRYDTLDSSLMKVNKGHQEAVYDGLRAYLPFRGNDGHFLYNGVYHPYKDNPELNRKLIVSHPDWPIAETLVTRVSGTKEYDDTRKAWLPFVVLLSEPVLDNIKGYKQFGKMMKSGDRADQKTLDFINGQLKDEVLIVARGLYHVPSSADD